MQTLNTCTRNIAGKHQNSCNKLHMNKNKKNPFKCFNINTLD